MSAKSASKKKTRQVVKTGDVIAIPLPDGRYAFGLQIGEDTAIYSVVTDSPDKPPVGHRKFLFAVGVYTDVLSSMRWIKVAKDPITQAEIEFVSLSCIFNGRNRYEICSDYIDGYTTRSTENKCRGLEPVSAWDWHHVVDRIISSLLGEKSEWISIHWVPFGFDLSDPSNLRRVDLAKVVCAEYSEWAKGAAEILKHQDRSGEGGFGPAVVTCSSENEDAIRGQQQQQIDQCRKEGRAADQTNGVSPKNPKREHYLRETEKEFGKP